MFLFGVWQAVFGSAAERRREVATGLTLAVLGLVLALVCGSRYWDGWHVEYGQSLVRIGDVEIRLFKLVLPESAIHRPAQLMRFAVYPLIASTVLLFFAAAISAPLNAESRITKWLSILIPTALAGGSIAGLFWIKRWIGADPVILEDLAGGTIIERVRGVFLSEVNQKMAGVFLLMAALMGSIIWIRRDWIRRTSGGGKVLWMCSLFFALLWLLGMTSICETVVQTPFFILVTVGVLAAIFLNQTVWGRYMKALGNNEEAARYSGVKIDQMKILAYVLCAFCGGLGAILFTLDSNNVEPSGHGSFFELYAIAAAVLGGSSLRGGEGSILGVIIGATIMRVLYNAPDMIGIASQLEMFTIGIVILIGVIVDENLRRWGGKRN
jgi:ABC-type glucose/galactose transport system permease subunit